MSFLQDKIRRASQKYYSGETPDMTDKEFDDALDQLKEANPNDPLVTELGHGYDVNLDSTPGEKYKHLYGVAEGLDKVYTYKAFNNDMKDMECGYSLKLDGLSVVLYYLQGKLDKALTRGKDNIGIDITDKVLEIEPSYITLSEKVTGAFRGEILMTDSNFARFKEVHPNAKNSRNSAAGLINAGNPYNPELRLLNIYMYTIFGLAADTGMKKVIKVDDNNDPSFTTYRQTMSYLTENFKNIVPWTCDVVGEDNYLTKFNRLKSEWSKLGLPSDGIVMTDMIIKLSPSSMPLPYELPDEFAPYSFDYLAEAFKFKSETAQSKVVRVEWNMTKNRRCMPTVCIEPVELAGTTVQRCTGYNAKFIYSNMIGEEAIIEVEKRGEIVPNINKVIQASKSPSMISHCPDCDSKLDWNGVDLVCNNQSCSNAEIQDTLIWCKTIAPIDGLSDKLITKFINEYVLDFSIPSVMNFDVSKYDSDEKSQFGKFCKMIERLHSNLVPCDVALIALNIPRLGQETSKKLGKELELVRELIHTFDEESAYMTLRKVLGTADSKVISNNLHKLHRLILIEDRLSVMDDPLDIEDKGSVVITGKLSISRSKFEEELNRNGFKVASSVTKKTVCLITDNPNSTSSKNTAAEKLGVTKLSESEFRKRYL